MSPSAASAAARAVVTAARTITGAGNAVMLSAVAGDGGVGPSQCFMDDGRSDLYADAVDFAVVQGAKAVVVATSLAHLILDRHAAVVITDNLERDFGVLGTQLLVQGNRGSGGDAQRNVDERRFEDPLGADERNPAALEVESLLQFIARKGVSMNPSKPVKEPESRESNRRIDLVHGMSFTSHRRRFP